MKDENRHVLFPISIVPFETIKTWKDFDADTGKDSARDIREHYIPDFSGWKEAPEAVGIWENELTGSPHSEQKRLSAEISLAQVGHEIIFAESTRQLQSSSSLFPKELTDQIQNESDVQRDQQ